jgi:anti-sigma factor RsiW
MKCTRFRAELDDLVDGALSTASAADLERHAAACPVCAAALRQARELQAMLEALPRRVDPPADLWPAIERRLEPAAAVVGGRFGSPLRSWLAAAAVIVAAVGTVVVAYTVGRHQAQTVMVERRETPSVVPARLGGNSLAGVEAEFQKARSELLAALEQREGQLSAETVEIVYRNLRTIDEAIERISDALGEDPGNPMLAGQLTRAYQQQIQLLRRASRLPAEI